MTFATETTALSKAHGSTRAVDGLTMAAEAGQVFAFLGPNGAGRSSAIRMLLALQRPTSGSATVLDTDVGADPVTVSRRIGYRPVDVVLYPRLTGQRHIDWFAAARGRCSSIARSTETSSRRSPRNDADCARRGSSRTGRYLRGGDVALPGGCPCAAVRIGQDCTESALWSGASARARRSSSSSTSTRSSGPVTVSASRCTVREPTGRSSSRS